MTRPVHQPAAPYQVGDKARMLYSSDAGTTSGVIVIDTVTPLAVNGTWRISGVRPSSRQPGQADASFPRIEAVVGRDGTDRHDYVEPVKD